eukprot:2886247-Heterocapsa_arctica.AAC.1
MRENLLQYPRTKGSYFATRPPHDWRADGRACRRTQDNNWGSPIHKLGQKHEQTEGQPPGRQWKLLFPNIRS